ncbi:hypothetical protein C8Q76DRAFT_799891 [Earliella scabrosa]|nr:hypothetical protein C8Q76DRAFT_799891 [Earliella scabrosa]
MTGEDEEAELNEQDMYGPNRAEAKKKTTRDEGVLKKFFGGPYPLDLNNWTSLSAAVKTSCSNSLEELKKLAEKGGPKGENIKPEASMYRHLERIFDAVEKSYTPDEPRKFYRKFICRGEHPLSAGDPTALAQFPLKPNFPVVEVPKPRNNTSITDPFPVGSSLLWWRCPCAVLEVKAAGSDSPVPPLRNRDATVRRSLTQAADYARAIMHFRPFQLYVYSFIQCGDRFCVGLFDRGGISLSPEYSIQQTVGFNLFIAAIARVTWDMSPVDLGHDPSVKLLGGYPFDQSEGEYPQFMIPIRPNDEQSPYQNYCWRTVGPPLWSSTSFMGRGTSVCIRKPGGLMAGNGHR